MIRVGLVERIEVTRITRKNGSIPAFSMSKDDFIRGAR